MPFVGFLFVCSLLMLPSWAWAGISYVGGQCGGFAGTTTDQVITFTLTGGSDAAPLVGDFVIGAYTIATNNVDSVMIIDAPDTTDYTLLGTELYANDANDTNLRTAYRVMPNPTETTLTLSATGGGTGSVAQAGAYCIKVYRGVHATPLEQAVASGTAIDTVLVDPGSLTPTTTGTWVITVGGGATGGTNGFAYSSSDLTAFQEGRADDNNSAQIGAGHTVWTSGAVAPATWTWAGSDSTFNSHAWSMIALKPASVAGGGCTGAHTLMGVGGC